MEERELIRRLKNRDQEAMKAFISQYERLILPRIAKQLRDAETVKEVWIDVMQAVWTGIDSFKEDSGSSFLAWVSGIARNKAGDEIRRLYKRPRQVPLDEEWPPQTSAVHYAREDDSTAKNSHSLFLPIIRDALSRVNERYAKILDLVADGRSPETISIAIDAPLQTVHVKINQAAHALRKVLLADPRIAELNLPIPSHTDILRELRKFAVAEPTSVHRSQAATMKQRSS